MAQRAVVSLGDLIKDLNRRGFAATLVSAEALGLEVGQQPYYHPWLFGGDLHLSDLNSVAFQLRQLRCLFWQGITLFYISS